MGLPFGERDVFLLGGVSCGHYIPPMELSELQRIMDETYGDRDRQRGVPSAVAWLAEEVGELAKAVRKGSHEERLEEFADVLAWTASLANQTGVDLDQAMLRYRDGCPRCRAAPCACAHQ